MPQSINEKSKDVTSAPESGTRDKQGVAGKGKQGAGSSTAGKAGPASPTPKDK